MGTKVAWVVAGAPGSGKSTVAALMLRRLDPVPALLDKDTMYGGFVASALQAAGRPSGEREGPWYDQHIKVHEYSGMTATALQIRSYGCPVLLCGPFTAQVADPARWRTWVDELGGEPVRLVWIRSEPVTLRARLIERGLARDGQKLDRFDAFIEAVRPDRAPAVPHVAIDNRAGADLDAQVDALLLGQSPAL